MFYKIMIVISGALFFHISAMQSAQQLQLQVHIVLQKLMNDVGEDSIIIFPVQTGKTYDKQLARKESQKLLSTIALEGVRECLNVKSTVMGTTFLVATNKVDTNETNSTCSDQGVLRKKTSTKIVKKGVCLESWRVNNASFIVYNMPYYNNSEVSFNAAYGRDFFECIDQKKSPCLVLIDEDIYDRNYQEYNIYQLFEGKKKVFVCDRKYGILKKYNPAVFTETSCCVFSLGVLCSALLFCGYFS